MYTVKIIVDRGLTDSEQEHVESLIMEDFLKHKEKVPGLKPPIEVEVIFDEDDEDEFILSYKYLKPEEK